MKRCGLTPVALKGRAEESKETLGTTPLYRQLTQWSPTLMLRKEGMSRKCVFSRVGRKFLPQVGV